MRTVILRNSRKQYVLLLAVSLALVGVSLFVITIGDTVEAWIAWLGVVFFGLCVAVFIRQLVDNRPRILIDDRGLTDRTLGTGLIAWHDIQDAYPASINNNPFICLELRNTEDYLEGLSPFKRRLAKANTKLGFTPFSLNLSGVQTDPDEVLTLILMRIALKREKGEDTTA